MTKRLTPGQSIHPFPCGSFNQAMNLVDRQAELSAPPGPGDSPPSADTPILIATVKNTTATPFVERGIFGIAASAFTPPDITAGMTPEDDENEADAAILSAGVPLEIVTPDEEDHEGRWGVTIGPIGPADENDAGSGVVTGVVWARVDVTDATHKFANIQTGDRVYLKSATSGARMLYRSLQDEDGEATLGKQWAIVLLGGGGGSGGGGGDVLLVCINEDITGVTQIADRLLTADDIELTPEEEGDGYVVVMQDPPDDDFEENQITSLNLSHYKRRTLDLKFFDPDTAPVTGTAQAGGADTITLATDASDVDGFYVGDDISITANTGSGQTGTCTAYDGATKVATMSEAWSTNPDNTSDYAIVSDTGMILSTTVIDDPESDPPRKIVRYATQRVLYDEGDDFKVGRYKRTDYTDYEGEDWPPIDAETEEPIEEERFNARWRGLCTKDADGRWVLNTMFCKRLPPPPLESLGYEPPEE